MDKSWIGAAVRLSDEYVHGVENFLEFAFLGNEYGSRICCPCCKCRNRFSKTREDVTLHYLRDGFDHTYTNWTCHGEIYIPLHTSKDNEFSTNDHGDDMANMLRDAMGIPTTDGHMENDEQLNGADAETKRFFKLFPGCKKQTKLSFLARLLHLKVLCHWSNNSFNLLLELLRATFPDNVDLPANYYEANKITTELGFTCEVIDACPNNCMLFREERIEDGVLRHPADSQAWKEFDKKNLNFGCIVRNVRLGLATDGFNPYEMLNVSYSIWPVILMTYNLPPWLCMKQPSFILSVVIDSPKGPGNKIDVFLQPLVDELKELWHTGVPTYDSSCGEMFQLHAGLLLAISDFPGYSNISGNLVRHNLDVMHIEKNVCENVLFTLLDVKGKTKDNINARKDLQVMNIRSSLHPIPRPSGGYYLPASSFTMSTIEKKMFCGVLKNLRPPDGYGSNISRCIH
ncbi:UNVERIFIED_CONTAM: hypothetical protein Sradi_6871300 [Sesamum radiatum]|uniref:Transposase-associated domain-containing protein n=1 Tax=Sesamum radiatum TaxID=300843 RepID=A0AAW2JK99_SESRA